MNVLLLLLASWIPLYGQLSLSSQAPPSPVVGAGAIGARGGTVLYYWVVARYPAGSSSPSTAAMALNTVGELNLTVSNFVRVSWSAMAGATGYDVIRSSSPMMPASCVACAVVLNTSSTTVDDTTPTGSAWPAVGIPVGVPVGGYLTINNRDDATPYLNFQLMSTRINELTRVALISGSPANNDCMKFSDGRLVSAGAPCGSGAGGTPAGSSNDIQVNNTGAFGGGRCTMDSSQNLTCSGTVAAPVLSATGTMAGELCVYELAINGTEDFCWLAADDITTTQRLKPPVAANAANETMKFGAPSSNISAATWGLPLWANTTNANSYVDWTLGSAPGTNPASGDIRLYAKTGSTLCAKTSGGAETCFGSGGASAVAPFYAPFGPMAVGGGTLTATIGSANRVYHIAANAPAALSVSNVNLGTSNFGNLAVAFYDSSCTLIGQTATTATSATGVTVAVNSAPITIPAGKFYVSWTGDATASAIYGTSAGYVPDMWNAGATPEYFYGSNASTGTTTLTFPGTCGTRTAVANGANPQPPGIILR